MVNQYTVDMCAESLISIHTNQTKLRAENYTHLQDAFRKDEGTENLQVRQTLLMDRSICTNELKMLLICSQLFLS